MTPQAVKPNARKFATCRANKKFAVVSEVTKQSQHNRFVAVCGRKKAQAMSSLRFLACAFIVDSSSGQNLICCNQRIRNLFILPLSVGETALEPVDVLLGSYISGRAFVTLDKRLILPFFEIIFLDLVNFYASVVTAIIFPIDWQSLVLFHFQLIVLLGSEVTAGTQFT